MNYSCYNQRISNIHQSNLCNHATSNKTTAQFNFSNEVQQSKLKAKAYINPNIFNYEYIKKSLNQGSFSTTNKIHFNPYFKDKNLKKEEGRQLPLRSEEFASHSWGIKKENYPASKVLEKSKNMHFVKLASKYKLINKSDLIDNEQPQNSKYSWSKERLKNEYSCLKLNKASLINGSANVNDKPGVVSKKLENIFPSNQLKINMSKNLPKISNLACKALEKKPPSMYLTKMKIINLSSKKLFNNSSFVVKPNLKVTKKLTTNKIWVNQTKLGYNKTKCIIKVASLVRNKYKYYRGVNSLKGSKYKLDKRKKLSMNASIKPSLITNDIGKLFPNPNKTKYFYSKSQHSSFFLKKSASSWRWRKNEVLNRNITNKAGHYPNNKVIKIGGILYKSTSKKLTIANGSKKEKSEEQIKKLNIRSKKLKKNHFVYVRGEKFLLDKNGKTLIRQLNNVEKNKSSLIFKRIDIGGVTYLQKSQNILIRTNVHEARNIVNYAKQKSIAMLCQLKKRSALPCMMYHKFGKCIRHSKGLCMYKHDPKNIAICKRFLKGNCTKSDCLLSHEVIQEKMATCHFFLNGCCSKENCPFLHVKLNKNAEICENFLRGFCDSGQNCLKRHLFLCPEYDKLGKCSLGSKCHYPHKAKQIMEYEDQNKLTEGNETVQYEIKKFHSTAKSKEKKCKRPFLNLKNCQGQSDTKKMKKCKRKSSSSLTSSDQVADFIPKRIKLDKLPSFIPLTETK